MSRLASALGAIARHELGRRPFCELAVVDSVFDGDDGDEAQTISVTLKDSRVPIPHVPVATSLTGAAALPRVGDVVLVLFPRGDLASAVVAGQVYSDARRPPAFKRDEAVLVWPGDAADVDQDAVRIAISTDGGARKATISLGGDKDAQLLVEDGAVELRAGGVHVRIHHGSDSDGTAEIKAGGSKISVAQDGDVLIESAAKLTLKAKSIAIEGQTQVTVNGQTVEIN